MVYFEIALSFLAGVTLLILLCYVSAAKKRNLTALLINAGLGIAAYIALDLLNIVNLPLNPLNAVIIGFLGIAGYIVVYILTAFL